MPPRGAPPPPPTNPAIKFAARLASPEVWPGPDLDDGSKTYTRSEVLRIVSVVRQTTGDIGGREWAVAMLDEYDASRC